ncbi:cell wall / vacuolar inhibitor of fructosidase 1-like [Amaranthus tricolor]|uniref:cell wall / vacuolar inhibitor of fructosidase 1-like n=1 Tax=Amaranthus tricolor TaxID=29722 RepID=UPI002590BAB0|nr:cell wall / vacuolar inhibitor of fructosidase 1-like [Amaranthus tricolor]
MIDVVNVGFSNSLKYVKELSRESSDPDIIPALQECIWVYKTVVETSVNLAERAVKQGVLKFGEKAMKDASIEAEICMMGFPDGKVPERIMGWTPMLQGVSIVTASLIKMLE